VVRNMLSTNFGLGFLISLRLYTPVAISGHDNQSDVVVCLS
jgi:hypothetical protein